MSFLVGLLPSIGSWLLKIFLGGLFNKVMTKMEDDAQAKKDAAVGYADSAVSSAQLEVDIVKKQSAVESAYKAPAPTDDPFRSDQWNKGQ